MIEYKIKLVEHGCGGLLDEDTIITDKKPVFLTNEGFIELDGNWFKLSNVMKITSKDVKVVD